MVHQNISASFSSSPHKDLIISSGNNLKDPYFIKLGAFSFDVRENMTKEWELPCTDIISTKKLIFVGINPLKKLEEKQERKLNTIQPGSMLVTEPT